MRLNHQTGKILGLLDWWSLMGGGCISGAPNDDFPQNTLETLFRLSRVLLDL